MALKEEAIAYHDGDVELCGFLISHADERPRPGVIVVHGGAGLDDHARSRARQLAELGLLVFACDMHGEAAIGDRGRVIATITDLIADRDKLCQRALAGANVLASDRRVRGSNVAVGYCFGGRTVLELARSGAQLSGVVSVHGSLETANPARPGEVKAKILVCHGAIDPHIRTTQVTGFIDEMNAAQADYQLIVYGGAMHGFTHDTGSQLPGVAYHAASDTRFIRGDRLVPERTLRRGSRKADRRATGTRRSPDQEPGGAATNFGHDRAWVIG